MIEKTFKLLIFLLILIPVLLYSCGPDNPEEPLAETGGNTENPDNAADSAVSENLDEEPAAAADYTFPEADYGGADFTVLVSATKEWQPTNISDIVIEEEIGEVLNDSIYNRNLQTEEIFNVVLKQTEIHPDNIISQARRLITAGDDAYDAMFISHSWNGAIGTIALEGGLYNLAELSEINFSGPWWTRNVNEQLKIGSSNAQYFAMNDIVVHGMQAAMMMCFNESMLQDLNLDFPYDLVRTGKWTLDEYEKYVRAGTNINNDENWRWNSGGSSIYGHVSYHMAATALLIGTDVQIIGFDSDNLPYLAVENEHFYNAVQRLSEILSVEGHYLYSDNIEPGRADVFMDERALFVDGHLGTAASLREMETPFGILPMPKYDENQADYRTNMHSGTAFTVVPVTNADPGRAAVILDAMAYLSYKDVRPAYFEVALPNKHLRNEASVDMLQIIMDTRSVHVGYVYGWTNNFLDNSMRTAIQSASPNTASLIERNRDAISANISATVDFFSE